jgi:hypothetical protein
MEHPDLPLPTVLLSSIFSTSGFLWNDIISTRGMKLQEAGGHPATCGAFRIATGFQFAYQWQPMPERLPIYEIEQDIVASLKAAKRLILQAPTGSGKSTQVPQMMLKHGLLGDGQVVILQPRRLAARLLAARVARELGVELGREVGYQVRFENATSSATRIKFETEGILLRQLIQEPTLRHYIGPCAGHPRTTTPGPAHHRDVCHAGCGGARSVSLACWPSSSP